MNHTELRALHLNKMLEFYVKCPSEKRLVEFAVNMNINSDDIDKYVELIIRITKNAGEIIEPNTLN